MHITIIEDTSTESLYGDDSNALPGVDTVASEQRYLTMLGDAVHALWPTATIEVLGEENGHIPGTTGNVAVEDSDYADEVREEVDELRHDLWESWSWVVKTTE